MDEQKRVAIYARVSTKDRQEVLNQLHELREYCRRMKYAIVREYIDNESGAKGRGERKEFTQLFHDANKRKFDIVLFWALDRLTREGLYKTVNYLQQFESCGVAFHSFKEEYLNSDNEIVRTVLLGVLAALAQQERRRISERTKAGLETARRKGKRLGAPPKTEMIDKIAKLKAEGLSKSEIAMRLKIARGTVYKYSV